MKKLFYLIIVALFGLASCSMNLDPPDGNLKPWNPSYTHEPVYTVASAYDLHGEQTGLKMNIDLDTITPPLNPLHPIPTSLQDYPAFYGYLDCARFMNDKRYCALIGTTEAQNVYYLMDSEWEPFRYDSPIVVGCSVGELLYIRGNFSYATTSDGKAYLLLQVLDIEQTDSIITLNRYTY